METLQRFLYYPINQVPYVIFALIVAFTVHEFSHAFVAYKFGDPTAKNQGRLTLNPAVHLDPIGTILIFIAGFGWAKPVPVNYFFFKNKRLAGVLVSIAGPISNLLVATIAMGLWFALDAIGILAQLSTRAIDVLIPLFTILINLNVVLFIFNLIPLPPLDGYRVIEDLAPSQVRSKLIQYEHYSLFIFLILFITPVGDFVFGSIFDTIQPIIFNSLENLFLFIFSL
ncbi:site-2 protease family protein [Tepidibacillus infernus]|uniref:site-2 protease family protein n=1 Tax=Tepidibacillus infernus TaxID=1806172 RepID=UPI003B73D290